MQNQVFELHTMTTKNNFENLLQEIRDLDPTSPGAREKLQGYRIKILSAYKEIETFLKNEDLEDAARATIESRLQALANIYQSVRQLEDLLSKTDDAVVKSKEEENNDDVGDAIKSLQRDFLVVYEEIQKCINAGEKDSPKVRTLMERLLSIQTRLQNIESSMKGEKEVSSGEDRLEELGSILVAIQERYQVIASELQDLHQSKDPDREAVERLTKEMSELSEIAAKVRAELETIRDSGNDHGEAADEKAS